MVRDLRELSEARAAADAWPATQPSAPGSHRVGPWVLDKLIGRGGMGAVYLAHRADGEFEQQAAVKVIGLPLEIEPFRERFRRERQILAALSHPNIAHLLDGGTTEDGELYLAMEFVDGVAVDRHAAQLALDERLQLFREVCAGVQYAHQHLIVHRDIKPSNVLVNREGVPKLLDFGAAKLLAETGSDETTRLKMMTVAYASPEQLRGEAASTLSDVFSLGALLFELISGTPAFGGDLISRVAEFQSDGRALMLPAQLPGDLDRVVRKALAANPAERYASVEQLSEDVRRYQAGEPVTAHPPALRYRARKFVWRNRWAVSFAAIFVIGMVAMTAYSIRQARAARADALRAKASNQFLTDLFQLPFLDADSHHDMTVRELLELAEKRVTPALGGLPEIATDVDMVLGKGFESQLAREQARALFARALDRARRAGDTPRQVIAISRLASVAYQGNQIDEAWTRALESAELWKRSRSEFTPQQAVEVLATSGQLMQYMRPADPVNREYLQEAVRLAGKYPSEVALGWRAAALQALAESYLGSPGDADRNYREAYPLIEEALKLDRSDPSLAGSLLASLQSWGRINRFLGHYDADEAAQREAYQIMIRLLGPDHINTVSQRAIWAYSLAGIGKVDQSYAESQAALATMRRSFPVRGSFQLWTNTATAAYTACLTARFTECEALAREALETLGPHPQPGDLRVYEAKSYLGLALAGERRDREARPLLEETVAFYRSRNRQGAFRDSLERALAEVRLR